MATRSSSASRAQSSSSIFSRVSSTTRAPRRAHSRRNSLPLKKLATQTMKGRLGVWSDIWGNFRRACVLSPTARRKTFRPTFSASRVQRRARRERTSVARALELIQKDEHADDDEADRRRALDPFEREVVAEQPADHDAARPAARKRDRRADDDR